MITRFFNWLMPEWAKNPLMEFEWLYSGANRPRRGFVTQLLVLVVLLALTSLAYRISTQATGSSQNLTIIVWQSLYFPILTLQGLTSIAALFLGVTALDAQRQGDTWDNLRVTEFGAALALRARWMSILYQLRAPVALILMVRLMLALLMLCDLPAFGGHYIRMLSAGAPTLPAGLAIPLLSVAVSGTACILLPLLNIASSAALGIVLGNAIRERLFVVLVQLIIVVALIIFVAFASFAVSQVMQDALAVPETMLTLLLLSYSAYGDWGLLFIQLDSLGAIWQRLPLGVFAGFALAAVAFAQALIADGLIRLAVRVAGRQS